MNKPLTTLGACLLMAGAGQAATLLNFTQFNNDATALVDGSATGLSIVKNDVDVSGNNQILFNVTYTGADFNGDTINDTLTFKLRVQGYSGGTATTSLPNGADQSGTGGSVTLGTAAAVGTRQTTFFGQTTTMPFGSTVQFSIESIAVNIAGYGGASLGFDALRVEEGTSSGHSKLAIIGVGTNLTEREFNDGFTFNLSSNRQSVLFVSSAQAVGTTVSPTAWGIDRLGFDISVDVIPEPSTSAMLLGALGLLTLRRRRK
ncbi:MAG: PEP-CTERM sorting domain-containing protein [Luteolibacter sp.]